MTDGNNGTINICPFGESSVFNWHEKKSNRKILNELIRTEREGNVWEIEGHSLELVSWEGREEGPVLCARWSKALRRRRQRV